MPKKQLDWKNMKGKRLMLAGEVLLVIGIMRYFNIDWNIVLIVLGAFLTLKGLWVNKKS